MQRVLGIDTEAIKEEIAGTNQRKAIAALGGSGTFPNVDSEGNEFKLKVINNRVVTILIYEKRKKKWR